MKKKRSCNLCGETINEKPVVLLIGLADREKVRHQLSEPGAAALVLCVENTGEAKDYLLNRDGDAFFLLDSVVGDAVCLDFLAWLLERRPTYGAIIGEHISNLLAINGLNSGIVVDVLLRPVSQERWRRLLERRAGHSGEDEVLLLHRLKGNKPSWYGSIAP